VRIADKALHVVFLAKLKIKLDDRFATTAIGTGVLVNIPISISLK
jgi:hypothetical protein